VVTNGVTVDRLALAKSVGGRIPTGVLYISVIGRLAMRVEVTVKVGDIEKSSQRTFVRRLCSPKPTILGARSLQVRLSVSFSCFSRVQKRRLAMESAAQRRITADHRADVMRSIRGPLRRTQGSPPAISNRCRTMVCGSGALECTPSKVYPF
jgi:hypothetical protein